MHVRQKSKCKKSYGGMGKGNQPRKSKNEAEITIIKEKEASRQTKKKNGETMENGY